jgi:hypothetical protein
LLLTLTILSSAAVGADPADPIFEKPVHYLVENTSIVNRLNSTHLPMVDWGFVLVGHVTYVDRKTGQKLPLNDAHDLDDPIQVAALPIAVPFRSSVAGSTTTQIWRQSALCCLLA